MRYDRIPLILFLASALCALTVVALLAGTMVVRNELSIGRIIISLSLTVGVLWLIHWSRARDKDAKGAFRRRQAVIAMLVLPTLGSVQFIEGIFAQIMTQTGELYVAYTDARFFVEEPVIAGSGATTGEETIQGRGPEKELQWRDHSLLAEMSGERHEDGSATLELTDLPFWGCRATAATLAAGISDPSSVVPREIDINGQSWRALSGAITQDPDELCATGTIDSTEKASITVRFSAPVLTPSQKERLEGAEDTASSP